MATRAVLATLAGCGAVAALIVAALQQPGAGVPAIPLAAPATTSAPAAGAGRATPAVPATPPLATSRMAAPEGLPLVAYWSLVRRAEAFEASLTDPVAERARLVSIQDHLVGCMAAAGFTYYAQYPGEGTDPEWTLALTVRSRDNLAIPELAADRAAVEAFGYGVMSPTREVLARHTTALADDPNRAYVEGLSAKQQRAYERAMSGTDPDEAAANPLDPSLEGCQWEAERAFPDPAHDRDLPSVRDEFGALLVAMMDAGEDPGTNTDPRVQALNAEWRRCMVDAGVDVQGWWVASGRDERSDDAGPKGAFALAVATGTDGVAADPGTSVEQRDRDQESLVGSAPESAIAVADHDCRAATDYVARLSAVQTERELEFVADHRAELDRLEAWVGKNIP